MSAVAGIDLYATDVTGQKNVKVHDVPPDHTVNEVVDNLLRQMDLPTNDAEGHPLSYQARLDREGRHLQGQELVGDALEPLDRLVLLPRVNAG